MELEEHLIFKIVRNMNDNIEKQVIIFFNKHFWFKKIDKYFVLNEFFTTEDEVFFMLVDFFEHFNIDPKDFDILKYFDPEPSLNIFYNIRNGLKKKKKYSPLTIKHLIKVAEKGEWFNP